MVRRKIGAISEVRGVDEKGKYIVVPIFEIKALTRKADGKLEGGIEPTGNFPHFIKRF
jgi:pilus assembly protein CpaF